MTETLIPEALEYYDMQCEKHCKLFKSVKSHKLDETPYDLERNKILLYDAAGKLLLASEYEVVGIYSNQHKMWCWGWSVPMFKKNMTGISKKLLSYGLDLDNYYFLKTELITSRFLITDPMQLDIHVAVACYIAKKVVYKHRHYPDREKDPENYVVYYIFLLDADQAAESGTDNGADK
jgi:hypothetical protein